MQVDSELNLGLDRPEIAEALRQTLWGRHTNSWENANPERMDKETDAKITFEQWQVILKNNKTALKMGHQPIAPLREFLRADPTRSNSD